MKKRTSTLWSREKGKDVKLEDFTVLKVLGAGAFGTVLLVEEKPKGIFIPLFAYKFIINDCNRRVVCNESHKKRCYP